MGISQQLNRVDFVYNIVLLPTVTLFNYLPYTIKYQVDNSSIDVSCFSLINSDFGIKIYSFILVKNERGA